MKKRIVTKKGDVFCINISNQYKYYFQYVADDASQLNSSVIRVFKKKYPIDCSLNIDDIVRGEVFFYAHTILRIGILANLWEKIGIHLDLGDTENIMFKIFADSWYIWKIGCSHIKMDKLTTNQENYSSGEVFSPNTLIKRIKQISGDGSLQGKAAKPSTL